MCDLFFLEPEIVLRHCWTCASRYSYMFTGAEMPVPLFMKIVMNTYQCSSTLGHRGKKPVVFSSIVDETILSCA